MPLKQQQLLYNGKEMRNFEKLSELGVKDDDLVMMVSTAASTYVYIFVLYATLRYSLRLGMFGQPTRPRVIKY